MRERVRRGAPMPAFAVSPSAVAGRRSVDSFFTVSYLILAVVTICATVAKLPLARVGFTTLLTCRHHQGAAEEALASVRDGRRSHEDHALSAAVYATVPFFLFTVVGAALLALGWMAVLHRGAKTVIVTTLVGVGGAFSALGLRSFLPGPSSGPSHSITGVHRHRKSGTAVQIK